MAQHLPHVSDLIRDSQLTTRFLPDGTTQHAIYSTRVQSGRRRRIRVEETWRKERELGNGTFGRVWLEGCIAGPATGKLRAVKEIDKNSEVSAIDYSRELEAVAKFSHEKYVHCFVECSGWYESANMVFIAMEYLQHGDLQKYLNRSFPEAQVKDIASQLVEGLGYMHDNGFTHRDLKPANILVCQPDPGWWVKIADFGITKRAEQESTVLRTMIGTEGYLAPEVIGFIASQSSTPDSFYTSAVDVWALGELLFRMISKRPVFLTKQELFGYVVRGHAFPASVLTEAGASQDCCEFVTKSMLADPSHRLTAREASAHPWVQSLLEEPVADPEAPQECTWPDSLSNTGPVTAFEDTAQWSTAMFTTIGQTAYQDQRSMAANPNHYPTQEMQLEERKTMQPNPNALTNSVDHTQVHNLIGGLRNMNLISKITSAPQQEEPNSYTTLDHHIDNTTQPLTLSLASQSINQTSSNSTSNNPFRSARENGERSELKLQAKDSIESTTVLMKKMHCAEIEIATMAMPTDKSTQSRRQQLISQSDAILTELRRRVAECNANLNVQHAQKISGSREGMAELDNVRIEMKQIVKGMGELGA
ncbi:kinase-like domain-containing protein [Ilyonectria destructans]|nr:kinase-like domain-containing protein [Ilyonectria destructans]